MCRMGRGRRGLLEELVDLPPSRPPDRFTLPGFWRADGRAQKSHERESVLRLTHPDCNGTR